MPPWKKVLDNQQLTRGWAMPKTVHVHVGDTLEKAGQRFVDAWHRAERGELTPENAELHVGFESFDTMVRVLSPKRLALLRHVHEHPAKSIRALAQALGRDYHRVHEDVEALEAAGLLDRDKDGVRAEYGVLDVRIRVEIGLQNESPKATRAEGVLARC